MPKAARSVFQEEVVVAVNPLRAWQNGDCTCDVSSSFLCPLRHVCGTCNLLLQAPTGGLFCRCFCHNELRKLMRPSYEEAKIVLFRSKVGVGSTATSAINGKLPLYTFSSE